MKYSCEINSLYDLVCCSIEIYIRFHPLHAISIVTCTYIYLKSYSYPCFKYLIRVPILLHWFFCLCIHWVVLLQDLVINYIGGNSLQNKHLHVPQGLYPYWVNRLFLFPPFPFNTFSSCEGILHVSFWIHQEAMTLMYSIGNIWSATIL